MVKKNKEIPKGYKQTAVGVIPEGWEIKSLSEICLIKGEYGINAPAVEYSKTLPTYIRITDIDDNGYFINESKKSVNDSNCEKYYLKKGDVLFVRTGASVGKSYLYNENDGPLVFAGFLIRFRVNEKGCNSYYLWSFTKSKPYWDWVKTVCLRSGQPGINSSEYCSLKIPLPPLPEQQKIAEILCTWDKAIESVQSIIDNLKTRNKGLAQQLLTGKKRLKGFEKSKDKIKTSFGYLPSDWKLKSLSEVVDRVKRSFIPEADSIYREIGIRSHCKGIFHKEEVTGKSLGNKSVFWIEPDCFVVNIVFAWEQAVAKTSAAEKGMIASHRFPMFKPKKGNLDLDYLLYFFKSPKGKDLLGLASPGGAGRNKTLGQSEFLKLLIPVPPIEEQVAIVKALTNADNEIKLYEDKLYILKEQKKGMMQKLLTGEVRVKVSEL